MRKDDADGKPELIAIASQFVNFDEFTEVTAGWDIDSRQLCRGNLNALLAQFYANDLSLNRHPDRRRISYECRFVPFDCTL